MASRLFTNQPTVTRERSSFLVPIVLAWTVVAIAGIGFIWIDNDLGSLMEGFYLLPWVFLAGLVVLSPSIYLIYRGKFDLFHPLVFATWSYIFPAYVIGGVILAFGWTNPYFLTFIDDPEHNLPLTLVYICIGYLGLTAGFFIPVGRILAKAVEPRLPKWDWQPERVWIPGVLLLLAGIGFNILAFIQGIFGFQRNIDINIFDGLVFFLLTIFTEGAVLLWLGIFSSKERNLTFYLVFLLLLVMMPVRMSIIGSRSSLLLSFLPIVMAYVYSGRKVTRRVMTLFVIGGVLAVFIGVIYGTTFRNIKGSEARISAGDYFGQVLATVEYLSAADPIVVTQQSAQSLAERVENLSSVAVVVSNYEKLAPHEASYGLENNIINDLYTSFIPRFVWSDKPSTSDARAYSDLYFNYGDNSFAISPFADLLRNFGPIGIPIGMLILGIYLRFIYVGLIDTPNPAMWKKVAYFSLLTIVSYESFYATIFPSVVRLFFVLAVSLAIANLFAVRRKPRPAMIPAAR
jgi:hypothetical protein